MAALVFTVVSWGYLGIGGRAAVLLALTACALVLPRPLRRRRLTATAEAAAAVGLGLVLLDCYATRAAGPAGLDAVNTSGYWAVVTALVAGGASAYGWGQRLRFPLGAGFLLMRLPVPLALLAAGVSHVQAYAAALVGAAALDCALLWRVETLVGDGADADHGGPHRFLRRAAAGFALAWALVGGGLAVLGSMTADQPGEAAWAFGPLGTLALLGLLASVRYPALPYVARRLAAAGAGAALLMAAGGTLRQLLSPVWTPVAFGVPAAVLLVVAAVLLRRRGGQPAAPTGLFHVAALALLTSFLAAVPDLARAVLEPPAHAPETWAGTPAHAWAWHVPGAALTGLGLLAIALAAVMALRVTTEPVAVLEAATATAAVTTLALLPASLGLPYGVAVASALLLAAFAAAAVAIGPPRPAAAAALVVAPGLALLWASADRAASITALGVCAALGAVVTWRTVATLELPRVAPTAAAGTVLALGAEAAAVGTTLGLSLPATMLVVLAVAAASAPVAAFGPGRPVSAEAVQHSVSLSLEFTGYALAAVALLLTAPYPGRLAFALAVAGVAALAIALRPDRRAAAAVTATGLLIGSSWVRLALWDVDTPEAYTLTLACAALVVGHLRHRREPAASSWATYGPGLSIAMTPSVLVLWTDGYWLRPLLLGTAALTVTVLGVRFRLRSLLLLGGTALVLTAFHELAPTVAQVLGLLPRWLPLAVAGLLLLVLGATYEQRLRDARRLRDGLRRLR
ncbi:hypothetical protein GCM10010193_41280 [Kitasatospora atroaurantiaca]|uniref:Uncharacterized protein n=1 Tax=Kitasatospora atroaurantiaca TaxID=285545 RepID=A0A561F1A4_9ACTN|nr:hypothetical protein [Kitasatospora atroaurantiaca]TWE21647.1 hypothetical protein FB465_6844 [Kitasatospora atroaurantiaca]